MSYDAIIFDCDGTLVDSEEICNQVLVSLVNKYVSAPYDIQHALNNWAGHTISKVIDVVEGERRCTLPDDIGQQYVEACNRQLKLDLQPVANALNFVAQSSEKVKICVGSNGERKNVFESLALCQFSPLYFNETNIFTRIQVEQGKPAPDLFLFAADQIGVAPERCLVIEDSPTGTLAGVAAGMDVFGFTGTAHDKESQAEKLKKAGAARVFDDFIHMGEALGY